MKAPAKEKAKNKKASDGETLRTLRHDINNQLSNIHLALEQLRYEINDVSEDCNFYLESIGMSAAKINTLLSAAEQ